MRAAIQFEKGHQKNKSPSADVLQSTRAGRYLEIPATSTHVPLTHARTHFYYPAIDGPPLVRDSSIFSRPDVRPSIDNEYGTGFWCFFNFCIRLSCLFGNVRPKRPPQITPARIEWPSAEKKICLMRNVEVRWRSRARGVFYKGITYYPRGIGESGE